MKVLISGQWGRGSLEESYRRAFEALGHKTIQFNDRVIYQQGYPIPKNRITKRIFWKFLAKPVQSALLERVRETNPDLVFVLKGWYFKPETLRQLKQEFPETELFCFNPENPWSEGFAYSNEWMRESIPIFDSYFTWGRFLISKLEAAGATRVEHLPFAHDPSLHYPVSVDTEEQTNYDSDIAFIGTWSKERERVINRLLDFEITIWGNRWEKAAPSIQDRCTHSTAIGEEFSMICKGSNIMLDVLREQMIPSHSMKSFEIPACRGFLLCNKGKELDDFYRIGRDIVCYSDLEDIVNKVNYYLTAQKERERIAKSGREVAKKHTYRDRAEQIVDVYKETCS